MILVTGATGLAGSFAVPELLRRGHVVRALCRAETAAKASAPGVEIALGDLGDPDSLARAARGAWGIVHMAVTVTQSAVDIAAMRVLLANWTSGPFVYISSLDVYGLAGPEIVTEDTPMGVLNDYSRGKVECERLLIEAAARAGRTDYVILRAPYIWGPHPTARARLVTARLADGRPIVLPGADRSEWATYQDVWIDARDFGRIVAASVARPRVARSMCSRATSHGMISIPR